MRRLKNGKIFKALTVSFLGDNHWTDTGHISSIIKADQPLFVMLREAARGCSSLHRAPQGYRRAPQASIGRRKPPQGAALISMRDYDWLNRVRTHREVRYSRALVG